LWEGVSFVSLGRQMPLRQGLKKGRERKGLERTFKKKKGSVANSARKTTKEGGERGTWGQDFKWGVRSEITRKEKNEKRGGN